MGGTPVIGVVNLNRELVYWPVYAQILVRGATQPYSDNNLLLPEVAPTGVDVTSDVSNSVTAAAGTTATGSVSLTFTLDDKRAVILEGTLIGYVSLELDLAATDATYAGTVEVTTVDVDVINYDAAAGTGTTVASLSKTVDVSLSGTATATKSWLEFVAVDVPKNVFGSGNYLQIKVTVNFSATTNASATTATEAVAKLICDGGTKFMLPVV